MTDKSGRPSGLSSDDGTASVSTLRASIPDAVRFYIDCEFDGHNGPLLSIAIIPETGSGVHIRTTEPVNDNWVYNHVLPLMDQHCADDAYTVRLNRVGFYLRRAMAGIDEPVIIADSPVDIGRFCAALSTSEAGGWASADYPKMTFEVHNVDCYPTDLEGAVQHNAWWDAMALRHLLQAQGIEAQRAETLGSVHESPVRKDAPDTSPNHIARKDR